MAMQKPGLYGVTYLNRDFTQSYTWGKNQFNSSFPAGLTNVLASSVEKRMCISCRMVEYTCGISPNNE